MDDADLLGQLFGYLQGNALSVKRGGGDGERVSAKGSATVTVTASDGSLTAQQSFTATVPNRAPEAVGHDLCPDGQQGVERAGAGVWEFSGSGHGHV